MKCLEPIQEGDGEAVYVGRVCTHAGISSEVQKRVLLASGDPTLGRESVTLALVPWGCSFVFRGLVR